MKHRLISALISRSISTLLVGSSCLIYLPALADDAVDAGKATAESEASQPTAASEASQPTAASEASQPTAASEASQPAETSPDTAAEESKLQLKGGVRGSALRLEEGLVMIESSAKMVQSPALEIAKECTRKETAVMSTPNYVGNGIVIPAIGNPSGTIQLGELPARLDRVEGFLQAAESAIKALKTHVDGLIIPEDSHEKLMNLWKGMQSTMNAAENNINSMRELVAQVPAKKGEIKQKNAKPLGRAALKVYDSMTALEKIRSQMDEIVKPEIKEGK